MPYTAPLKSLLSAQHVEYSEPPPEARSERPGLFRSASDHLQNSRSYSSTSYVRRHRRSPSCKLNGFPASEPASRLSPIIDPHASLRQSPPPVSNAAIPPGAMISPPESAPNSDEESPDCGADGVKLEELAAAVRSIEQRRESSPQRSSREWDLPDTGSGEMMGPAEQLGTVARSSSSITSTIPPQPRPNGLRLSKSALKIAHSRSSTETAIDEIMREEALTSSPDDSDAESIPNPPMVRKKSGELVRPALRPASRRRPSSMPGTPVYAKAVHFDSQLEHIRHFMQLDRPLAVSAETSPVDSHDADSEFPFGQEDEEETLAWEWELRLSNFPKGLPSRNTQVVRLEKLFLSAEKNVLFGSVAVANLAFHKHVAARFTFDYWRTVSEVSAVYNHDVRRKHAHDGYDRFSFDIKLDDQANLENKTMFVCIRYNVDGREFWDNNNGMNFQVDFSKSLKSLTRKPTRRSSLPRSRAFNSTQSVRPQSMPPSFDEFPEVGRHFPFSTSFAIDQRQPLGQASDDIDTVGPPKRRENPHRQAFANRYDFGASLTAAMRTKPEFDRTTLTARARSEYTSEMRTVSPTEKEMKAVSDRASPVSEGARKEDLNPSSLVSSKPYLESSGYKELVDKYCFFSSPKSDVKLHERQRYSPPAPSPPLSPRSPAPFEPPAGEAYMEARPSCLSPAPASLSPRVSSRASPSPMPYHHYPNHQTLQSGFLNDPQSSPVLRGNFDISFLEMSTAVDSFSTPSFAHYAFPTSVGAR